MLNSKINPPLDYECPVCESSNNRPNHCQYCIDRAKEINGEIEYLNEELSSIIEVYDI